MQEDDEAPEFTLPNQDGDDVSPDWSGVSVVYFYPKDATPGCTMEARQFEEEYDVYSDAGVSVYGVSTDDVDSHCDFAEEHGLSFHLLADADGDVAGAFGVLDGEYASRTTFVVEDGEVSRVYEDVDPDGHARDVMLDLMDSGAVEYDLGMGDADIDVDIDL